MLKENITYIKYQGMKEELFVEELCKVRKMKAKVIQ